MSWQPPPGPPPPRSPYPPYGQGPPQTFYAPPPGPPPPPQHGGGYQQQAPYYAPPSGPPPPGGYPPPPGPPTHNYGGPPPGPPPQGFGAPSGPPPQGFGAPSGPPPQSSYYSSPPPPPSNYPGGPSGHGLPPGPPSAYGAPFGPPPSNYGPPSGPPPNYGSPAPFTPSGNAPPPGQGSSYEMSAPVITYLGAQVPNPMITGMVGNYDATSDVETIRKATKGFGTDDSAVLKTIARLDPIQLGCLQRAYQSKTGKVLLELLEKETSSWFWESIRAVVMGPLGYDVYLLHTALSGPGTKENVLTELLLSRNNTEIHLLSAAYRHQYKKELADAVRGDLSMKTERLFTMALTGNRPPELPPNQIQVNQDVEVLYQKGENKVGTDEIAFCEILVNRSQLHLQAICNTYKQKHKKKLSKVIKSEFSGHMREALSHIVKGVEVKHSTSQQNDTTIWRDAKLIEKAMAGLGTKDAQLIWRIARAHWNKPRLSAIKQAYKLKYKKSLEKRVEGETSGSYKKMLLEMLQV